MGRAIAIILGVVAGLFSVATCVGSEEYRHPSSQFWVFTAEIEAKGGDGPSLRPDTSEPIPVPADPGARHRLVQWSRLSNGHVEAVTRRDGRAGTSFARREIDCEAMTFRRLGEGATLADALADAPNPGFMTEAAGGTISADIAPFVCRRADR
jgi:hypothetical protein